MNLYDVVKRLHVTERSVSLQTEGCYTFAVDPRATKVDVRNAIEQLFSVKVDTVRTMNLFGKRKRVGKNVGKKSDWKKAIVTLKEGEKIEIAEGA